MRTILLPGATRTILLPGATAAQLCFSQKKTVTRLAFPAYSG
jgi:hypothetical protein